MNSSGKLYLVGTPIGNLSDITHRAVKTLEKADFICAEDTRVTAKLLNYLEIKKPLISYREHSTDADIAKIVEKIAGGKTAAEVTDAGMPSVSDPGTRLVSACIRAGIEIDVVPGPTALTTAAAVSGMNVSRFTFEGFLSVSKKQRFEHLNSLAEDRHTLIFYEAPHKLLTTLTDFLSVFGDRKIAVCRELTKLHQEVLRTTVSEAIKVFTDRPPKGEFVLIVEGFVPEKPEVTTDSINDAADYAISLMDSMKMTEACKLAAEKFMIKKSEIYSRVMEITDKIN
ncbi:MAG: 16S rRNA (cytidine(1402)-2'-O)-methyltransferase [Ruminococcus sp.]|jgi:16S rRNA (cytidine1402-2'-O)-methyltransferase|nr:16S rRNA (cytidine(1402)-2'-O)-methyltransferase [Ruminococcus sp.]